MPTIEIAAELLAFIKSRAEPWIDRSEQDTIGRLVGFQVRPEPIAEHRVARPLGKQPSLTKEPSPIRVRRKKPKVGLQQLLDDGYLRRGQKLFLIDYQNTKVAQAEATVGARGLVWKESEYSMSDLAAQLLKTAGYSSSSVRGPAHWVTDEGVTVLQLWQRYSSRGAG